MSAYAFQPQSPIAPPARNDGSSRPVARAGLRPRLALVSASDELCGIGAYCHALQRQLADAFDVTLFGLNQFLLRASHPRLRKIADRHIKQICREIAKFDAVNLQLEHGTLGRTAIDIYRRFGWLLAAAPQISVTFHTMIPPPEFDFAAWGRAIIRFNLVAAARLHADYLRGNLLSAGLMHRLARAQRLKRVSVIVHNKHDRRQMKYIYRMRRVFDHPLSFLDEGSVREIRASANRRQFPILCNVPGEARLIGVFGFYGRYKGFETVIRAMQHLPDDYHLLIFGSVHPNEIHQNEPIYPYIANLLDSAFVDSSLVERMQADSGKTPLALSVAIDGTLRDVLVKHPKDLSNRLHFMGALGERDFLCGMAVCDVVVMPYLDVGQSSSGPMAQSVELGCRVVASRTRTFLQYALYHKDAIEFFDIGNHLELAERIKAPAQYDRERGFPQFNVTTNRAVYLAANRQAALPAKLRSMRLGGGLEPVPAE